MRETTIDFAHEVRLRGRNPLSRELYGERDDIAVTQDAAVAEPLGRVQVCVGPRGGEPLAVGERDLAVAAIVNDEQRVAARGGELVDAQIGRRRGPVVPVAVP